MPKKASARRRKNKNESLSNEKENKTGEDNKGIDLDESPKKSKKRNNNIQKKNKKMKTSDKNENIKNKNSNKRKAKDTKEDKELTESINEENNNMSKNIIIDKNSINKDILDNINNISNSNNQINNNVIETTKVNNYIINNNNEINNNVIETTKVNNYIINNNNDVKINNDKKAKIFNPILNNKYNYLKENQLLNEIIYNKYDEKIEQNKNNEIPNNINFINNNINNNGINPQNNQPIYPTTNFGDLNNNIIGDIQRNNNTKILSKVPNYIKIFEKINIFNSILIMINNISIINNYFYEDEIIKKISIYEMNNKYCLTKILYYINKDMWYTDNQTPKYDLFGQFTDFINFYTQKNCLNSFPEKYCYEIKNIELIINFIYNTINKEFTQINKILNKNINNNNNAINDSLYKYIFDFYNTNMSIIAINFCGFYKRQISCENCKRSNSIFKTNYNNQYSYDSFSYFKFNLNEIKNNKSNNNNSSYNICNIFPKNQVNSSYTYNNNNNNQYSFINLNDCFNFYFMNQNKKYSNSYCNICNSFSTKEESYSINLLPNTLTIILTNNDNCNLILQDELNMINYSMIIPNNSEGKYMLISILFKNIYNEEFICYCINPNNGLWYSYTNGNIKNVTKIDTNAIPLVLIYQVINKIEFEYKSILRDDLKKIKFNFMNGFPSKELLFNKNTLIKNIKNEIISNCNLGNSKITLVTDGKILQENQYLYEVINIKNEIFVMMEK